MKTRKLQVGDWIEVRSKEEILRTLDHTAQLDGMPFMPEMFAFCGKRFRVHKRAHKTCDTVFPVRGRRVDAAVHLETRCNGQAHDGCQAGCLIFWKEAWLKRVDNSEAGLSTSSFVPLQNLSGAAKCTESDVYVATQIADPNGEPPTFVCQATRLPYATENLNWWDIRQYIEDYRSGNVGLWQIISGSVYATYYNLSNAGLGLGRSMSWLYNKARFLWKGSLWPRTPGRIPAGQPTPTLILNLQPGELVRVKPHQEILGTLTTDNRNRGMTWDAELVPYCGGTYRVRSRVTKIIHEQTGKMQEMKSPCIILESVVCKSRYSGCRMFCPREIYPWWREIWLERVEPMLQNQAEHDASESCSDSVQMTSA